MSLKISELEALENNAADYVVSYDEIKSASTYTPTFVLSDASATALMTREKAYKVADILAQEVTNAKNIKVQKKIIGEFGADAYEELFVADVLDVSGYSQV